MGIASFLVLIKEISPLVYTTRISVISSVGTKYSVNEPLSKSPLISLA